MGLLNIFSGKDPEAFEQKGDILFERGEYGTAKLEYEAGLMRLEKKFPLPVWKCPEKGFHCAGFAERFRKTTMNHPMHIHVPPEIRKAIKT